MLDDLITPDDLTPTETRKLIRDLQALTREELSQRVDDTLHALKINLRYTD
jgi:hypothetical protein